MKEYEDGTILSEDPTCDVLCECGRTLFISDHGVFRCTCGLGYRSVFKVMQYDKGEKDVNYPDEAPIRIFESS